MTIIKRRTFLQMGSLATASLFVPKFLKAFDENSAVPPGNKVVVIIQLSGGNDGLNTVIPVTNDIYYRSRPRLAIAKDKANRLTDEVSLHPVLTGFRELYDEGSLAILNNVGYPNPSRSHFRSMDIWHTASDAKDYLHTGWIGRYLDAQCSGCDKPTQALEIDDVLSLALKGEQNKAIALQNAGRFFQSSNSPFFKQLVSGHRYSNGHEETPVDYLYKTMATAVSSADYIYQQTKTYSSNIDYPDSRLGKDMKTIASLALSNINTRVYYVSLGSFDTHVNQANQQQRLLKDLNDSVAAFTREMKQHNRFDDVLLFTFSEFGRRVSQNASGGTDHGTANNMFFISGRLKQNGLLNTMPNLSDLDDGDLRYSVDFKSVYATVLSNWLSANDTQVLGNAYQKLSFI